MQGAIQNAIYKYCQQKAELFCAGRTDTGVNAIGQVAHFDLAGEHNPFKLTEAVNFYLRQSKFAHKVAIIATKKVSKSFHARFDAIARNYQYKIIMRRAPLVLQNSYAWRISMNLDVEAMRFGAKFFLGEHNFNSFRCSDCVAKNPVRSIDKFEIIQSGCEILFNIRAKSFLHNRVRIMVGTLAEIGKHKYAPDIIPVMINKKQRKYAGVTAPAKGLCFMSVEYNNHCNLFF